MLKVQLILLPHCVEEASFISICIFMSIFQVCVCLLIWLSPLTGYRINNRLIKIFSTCSFYICMKAMILPFIEYYHYTFSRLVRFYIR